jgi:hypothetical protein
MTNQEITAEIQMILDGCSNGTLPHDQSNFFCGTARCVAGWKVHFDFLAEKGYVGSAEELMYFAMVKTRTPDGTYDDGPADYATWQWNLELGQSYRLFNEDATFEQQYAVLEELKI